MISDAIPSEEIQMESTENRREIERGRPRDFFFSSLFYLFIFVSVSWFVDEELECKHNTLTMKLNDLSYVFRLYDE